jgi:single-strand DNA-binding protein
MLLGNLGGDAILCTVGEKSAINFSVAHTNKFKNKDGVVEEKTTWWDCTVWRNAGQSTEIAKYLKRGIKVLCEGEPSAETYTDKSGTTHVSMKCFVKNIELLSSIQKEESKATEQQATNGTGTSGTSEGGDDLPF